MTRLFALLFALKLLACIAGLIAGCGRANADGSATAALIQGPPGYTCFAVSSGGQVVSGNCVKE